MDGMAARLSNISRRLGQRSLPAPSVSWPVDASIDVNWRKRFRGRGHDRLGLNQMLDEASRCRQAPLAVLEYASWVAANSGPLLTSAPTPTPGTTTCASEPACIERGCPSL